MVRKPTAAKNIDKALTPENPSVERAEPQPSDGNIKSAGVADSQLENPNPMGSPLKHPNFLLDGVGSFLERSPALEQVNQENELQKKSTTMKKRKSKLHGSSVRRSERIKSAVILPSNSNRGIEYIEDITVRESEKDVPATQLEKVIPELEPEHESEPAENLNGKSFDEKLDYVLQRIEALDKLIKLLKPQVDENIGVNVAPSISYQSMYIDSQKKLKTLTDENQRLTGKLENALGKIEVYENQTHALIDLLDKMKDVVNAAVATNLARTTEAALNASTQAIRTVQSASEAKRRRNVQES